MVRRSLKYGFSPPEQYTAKGGIGPWTDVYAICATIYWCMTGRLVPEAMDRMMGDSLMFLQSIPQGMVAVLRCGLALKPADRIRDVNGLERELEKLKLPIYTFVTKKGILKKPQYFLKSTLEAPGISKLQWY